MNEHREPGPTESFDAPLPDRTTVHAGAPTVDLAENAQAPSADETVDRPATARTGSLESRDPSLISQALGFALRGEASDSGEPLERLTMTLPPTEEMPPEGPKSRKPRGKRIGPELPGYEILEVIGRGGMGVVYKALHTRLDRLVALKMVLAGAHASPDELARFSTESQAVAQLQHPGIVQIYEVGEHDGLPYFSLEFVSGGSLAHQIDGKPQPTREAAEMVRELTLAMREAHRRNIIHRDLKPANVLLTSEGAPKITDFGLAKRLDADSQQTHTGAIMGSPSYMAPEQAWGQTHQIGPLTDVYALGAILYELLIGRPPFQGATVIETIELVRTEEPVPPTRLQPKIPVDLETICLKCLQKDPGKRYSDANSLAEDLQRFLEDRPILARPAGTAERLARWCRRNPKVARLTGIVAGLLILVATVSTYAAVSLKRANGRLDASNKAESAARQEAQTNERAAVKARDLEAAARKRESEARAKAEKLVTLAMQQNKNALNSQRTISVLLLKRLRDYAGSEDLRDELIKTSVKELHASIEVMDQLAAVGAHDKEAAATATRTLAGIYQQAGGLMDVFGNYDDAMRYFRQMDELAEALATSNPGQIEARRLLAISKQTIGQFEMDRRGDSKAALVHLNQNLELRREFLAAKPSDDQAKRGVCNALGALGRVWLKLGDSGKATSYYNEEIKLRGEIGAKLAGQVEFRREGAGLEEKLGDLYVSLGDQSAGSDRYDRALELRQGTARQNPGNDQAQRDVLLSFNKLGTFYLLHRKDPAKARDFSEKALDGFKKRLLAAPESVEAKQDLGATHYFVATAALRAGDRKSADVHYREFKKICEGLAGNPKAELNIRDLMIARARCGEHKMASKTAKQMITSPPLDVRVYYYAACAFSLCAGALADEPASPETKALARDYTESAFQSLRLAQSAGWKNVVDVETDPDLDAIRNAPGFDAIVAELRKAAGK